MSTTRIEGTDTIELTAYTLTDPTTKHAQTLHLSHHDGEQLFQPEQH